MNKAELVEDIAKTTRATKAETERFLDATVDVITKVIQKKESVKLVGFGTFGVSKEKLESEETLKQVKKSKFQLELYLCSDLVKN